MRILVLCRSQLTASQAMQFISRDTVGKMHPIQMVSKDDSDVVFFPIRTRDDVYRLRGQRFDLVLENSCFNKERSEEKGRLFHEVCIQVLR